MSTIIREGVTVVKDGKRTEAGTKASGAVDPKNVPDATKPHKMVKDEDPSSGTKKRLARPDEM